jgi:DNA replication protein DnaC
MTDTTSTNKKTSVSSLFSKFDIVEDCCEECGTNYEKEFKIKVPKSEVPHHYKSGECWKCKKIKEEKEIGRQIEEARLKKLEEKDKARKQQFYEIFEENSLMNPKLRQATFENFIPPSQELEKAKTITKRYADNFSKDNPISLLLIGSYGTGKSHLSSAISKELLKKEFTSIFVSTPKLLTKIRSTYNKTSFVSEEELLKILSEVDLLVLDDIGAESTKQSDDNQHTWATSKIFEIIDNRIGKHTIFTSNYEPMELQKRLGGRNFSRMMENVHVIKMYGDDYRIKDFK